MSRRVGVDIGSSEVRAVEVTGFDSHGLARVTRVGVAPLREGSVVGGQVKNHVTVSQALHKALRAAGVSSYGFVLGLSSPSVAIGRIDLPAAVKAAEREGAIRHAGTELGPTVRLNEAALSTTLAGIETTGEGHTIANLVVAAARRDDVETLRKVCQLVRCNPRAIDLSGAALLRALVRVERGDTQVATIVDIGAAKTMVVTRRGPHLRSMRIIPSGGVDLTRAIASASGRSLEDAERQKYALRVGSLANSGPVELPTPGYGIDAPEEPVMPASVPQTASEEALLGAVDHLVDEIAESIESDAANNGGSYTRGVTLAGNSALLLGLKERLSPRVGVPVHVGRPFATIIRNRHTESLFGASGKVDERRLLSLSLAVGLACWKEPK